MQDIPANFVRVAFEENSHEFIIVEDVTLLERALNQLVGVLLDSETMLAKEVHCDISVVDHVGRHVRIQEVVCGLRARRDLLALGSTMTSRALRTA